MDDNFCLLGLLWGIKKGYCNIGCEEMVGIIIIVIFIIIVVWGVVEIMLI